MEKRGYMLQEYVGHELDVNCLSIGKKSNRVFLTGGEDGKVNHWSIGQSSPSLSLHGGHTSGVESVAFDSGEVLVLAGASNGSIKLWDLEEAKLVRSVASGHRSSCTSVEFHPFGEFFASGSSDTDLKIWDIRKKGCIHTYSGHSKSIESVRFTPDGRWVVTGGKDNIVKVWDLTAGKLMHEFKYHCGPVHCLQFHPNEFLLATGSGDRTVKFWDLETFEIIGSTGPEASSVRAMAFHPDGRTVFCGMDNALKVYSWEPVRCHDVVEIGWSNLADVTIYEGKLLAFSLLQSRVALWIADISLIAPYALGVVPTPTDFADPVIPAYTNNSVKEELVKPALYSRAKTPEQTIVDERFTRRSSANSVDSRNMMMSPMSPDRSVISKRDSKIISKTPTSSSAAAVPNRSTQSNIASKFSKIISPVVRSKLGSPPVVAAANNSNNNNVVSSVKKRAESPPVKDIHEISTSVSVPIVVPRENEHERRRVQKGVSVSARKEGDPVVKSQIKGGDMEWESGREARVTSPCLVSFSKKTTNADDDDDCVTSKLEKSLLLNNNCCDEKPSPSPFSTTEKVHVKYVRGVAVPLGKTKSIVDRFEKKDDFVSIKEPPKHDNPPLSLPLSKGAVKIKKENEEELMQLAVIDEESVICNALMENHDFFINSLKSRLTKLQVVRHFLEKDGIKGAIDAVSKLPDHSVQVDLISGLKEKVQGFNLELFSCLLPILVGLLSSKIDRHIILSLEMTNELIKIFGNVIRSTLSATSRVGVDVQAEQRLKRCKSCFSQLQKMLPLLHPLTLRGGEMGKLALLLNLSLQNLQG
ncbi:hypothetical protein LUZ60_005550 [Juncus effusus]|nr:hypothetical protein LUZ60_005550 [Juncus effusus]